MWFLAELGQHICEPEDVVLFRNGDYIRERVLRVVDNDSVLSESINAIQEKSSDGWLIDFLCSAN